MFGHHEHVKILPKQQQQQQPNTWSTSSGGYSHLSSPFLGLVINTNIGHNSWCHVQLLDGLATSVTFGQPAPIKGKYNNNKNTSTQNH